MDRSGVAAMELAIVGPVLVTLMIGGVDFGAAMLSKAQIIQALSGAAGQNSSVTQATIVTNTESIAGAVSSPFLVKKSTNAVVNNGAASGSVCCPGSSWSCSTASGFTCSDGSSPGTYITITATYTFTPLFSGDTRLVGKTLTGTITAPLK
jgi:Flp pilus assembly protein TadG